MTPRAQMSVRWSTRFEPRTCSGDMYIGEPSTSAGPVSDVSIACSLSDDLEMPKSSTFTSGLPSARRVRNRLLGLRSRCTTPRACASATPAQAWRT